MQKNSKVLHINIQHIFRNSFYEPNRKREFLKFAISFRASRLWNKVKVKESEIILNLDNENFHSINSFFEDSVQWYSIQDWLFYLKVTSFNWASLHSVFELILILVKEGFNG